MACLFQLDGTAGIVCDLQPFLIFYRKNSLTLKIGDQPCHESAGFHIAGSALQQKVLAVYGLTFRSSLGDGFPHHIATQRRLLKEIDRATDVCRAYAISNCSCESGAFRDHIAQQQAGNPCTRTHAVRLPPPQPYLQDNQCNWLWSD